ncbi:fluoride efflux transporter CrcB [Micromonospora sp. NPDC050417]|uniref:fluoride efflux transporter CrcB n=1 Tax=Micromonospora sp. NPDC050417 TaxID=3364280 RepID=UPI0037A56DDD
MIRKATEPHGGPPSGALPSDRLPWDVVAAVALGGALGSAARYGVGVAWPTPPGHLPWATLVINLTGSALLGVLMGFVTARIAPHRLLRPFLGTGVLGGYTTFSTYAVETRGLLDTGRPLLAAGYVFGTLAGALAAVWLGGWLVARIGPKP